MQPTLQQQLLLLVVALGLLSVVHADGTAQLGRTQPLQTSTTVFVDVLASDVAQPCAAISWRGTGTLSVDSPSLIPIGS